jgi:hypothetical protein
LASGLVLGRAIYEFLALLLRRSPANRYPELLGKMNHKTGIAPTPEVMPRKSSLDVTVGEAALKTCGWSERTSIWEPPKQNYAHTSQYNIGLFSIF